MVEEGILGGGEGRARTLAMTRVRQMPIRADDGLASEVVFLRPIAT